MSSPGTGFADAGTAMGRVLLVCADSATIQQMSDGMEQLAISTEVCSDVSTALRQLNRKKFEAIIVDFGLYQADEMLGQVRLSPSNRTAVTFAITDLSKQTRFSTQPNFLMEKPLSAVSVGRTLKAAFGLIVRERRRSFRCPVQIEAAIQVKGEQVKGEEDNCRIVNISEGGMAIMESLSLKPGARLVIMFSLPGELLRFKIESEVCWFDGKGRCGLRSLMVPSEQKSVLQQWLAVKLEEDLPESVARQFRKE